MKIHQVKNRLHPTLAALALVISSSTCTLSYAGNAIFSLVAQNKFPGTGASSPVTVNPGESLTGTYVVTLSAKWPSKARVVLANLPEGMSIDATTGCGLSAILNPGQSCMLTLKYLVPSVKSKTLINSGPIVCTSSDHVHCSKPDAKNSLNMQIAVMALPKMLLEGLQGLLLGNVSGNLNEWFKINRLQNYNDIAYGNGRYIIVGSVDENSNTTVLSSTDGINWKNLNVGNGDSLSGIYFSPDKKEWVLYGVNGVLYHSNDGVNFQRIKLNTGNAVSQVAYIPTSLTSGYWLAISSDPTNYSGGKIFTSANGVDWTAIISANQSYTFISFAYDATGRVIVLAKPISWQAPGAVYQLYSCFAAASNCLTASYWNTVSSYAVTTPIAQRYDIVNIVWNKLASNWLMLGRNLTLSPSSTLGIKVTPSASNLFDYMVVPELAQATGIQNQRLITNDTNTRSVIQTSGKYIYTSTNGTDWTAQEVAGTVRLSNLSFGQIGGEEVLVALNNALELYYARLSTLNSWSKIAGFSIDKLQNNLLFVADSTQPWHTVGYDNTILSSSNGVDWTTDSRRDRAVSIPSVGAVIWTNALSQWLIMSQNVNDTIGVSYSADGLIWKTATYLTAAPAGSQLFAGDYSPEESQYLLVGNKAPGSTTPLLIITSPDGKTWADKTPTAVINNSGRAILWNQQHRLWLITGNNGLLLKSSDGGQNWDAPAPSLSGQFRSLAYSPDLDQFLVLGGSNSNAAPRGYIYKGIYNSSNASISWSKVLDLNDTIFMRSAAWSSLKQKWVAVGFAGKIFTSTDGQNWTAITNWIDNPADWNLWQVSWNESLKLWIAVGGKSASQFDDNIIISSPDGNNWTRSTDIQLVTTFSLAVAQ